MGVFNHNEIILHHDVEVRDTMNHYDKIDQIKTCHESDGVEIVRPTIEIINHLQYRIKYISSVATCYLIRNNRLESTRGIPNKYIFKGIWEIVQFLSNDQKIFYLSKVVYHNKEYHVYALCKNNLQAYRNEKIDIILY